MRAREVRSEVPSLGPLITLPLPLGHHPFRQTVQCLHDASGSGMVGHVSGTLQNQQLRIGQIAKQSFAMDRRPDNRVLGPRHHQGGLCQCAVVWCLSNTMRLQAGNIGGIGAEYTGQKQERDTDLHCIVCRYGIRVEHVQNRLRRKPFGNGQGERPAKQPAGNRIVPMHPAGPGMGCRSKETKALDPAGCQKPEIGGKRRSKRMPHHNRVINKKRLQKARNQLRLTIRGAMAAQIPL